MAAVMDSHPESDVFNSQPAGIGRVAALGGLCAWNNLGRNIVFADRQMRLLAVHDETRFPDDDEPSQFDLDIHAIVEVPGTGVVVALNHLGWLRVFAVADIRSGGPMRHLQPVQTVELLDDIERLVVVGDRLVGSRPRREQAGGIVVSAPFGVARNGERLATEVRLEAFGEVTALAPWPDTVGEGLVVGGEGTVSTLPLVSGHPGRPSFHVEVGFRPMWAVWEQGLVWSAGPRPAADLDDYDWEQLGGGGFVGLDPADGTVVVEGSFPVDLAWGTGGVAVVLARGALCGVGRRGELVVFDTRDGRHVATSRPLVTGSLGIAHAALLGPHVVFGGNRDGYRLHIRPEEAVVGPIGATSTVGTGTFGPVGATRPGVRNRRA